MILNRERMRELPDTAPPGAGAPSPDPIGAWLEVLGALLRLPPADRAEIREELESHLRDRARDLMLAGAPEAEAASRAIAELGSAAQLADRYLAARKVPLLRRNAMQLTVLGLASAAAVLSVVAVSTPPAPPVQPAPEDPPLVLDGTMRFERLQPDISRFLLERALQPGQWEVVERAALPTPLRGLNVEQALSDISLRADFDGTPLEDVLTAIAEASGRPYIIRWATIESDHTDDLRRRQRSTGVKIKLNADVPVDRLLQLVNQAMDCTPVADPIEYRINDGILEIAARGYFDKSERTLIAYDLSAIAAKGVDTAAVVSLITSLVESEIWAENGGDVAQAHLLADRLFITAPPRMHERIRWVLSQLGAEGVGEGGGEQRSAATPSSVGEGGSVPILGDLPLLGHTFRGGQAR